MAKAQDWKSLYNLLSDLEFFDAAYRGNEFEVKGYWQEVETNSFYKITDAYNKVCFSWNHIQSAVLRIEENRSWKQMHCLYLQTDNMTIEMFGSYETNFQENDDNEYP